MNQLRENTNVFLVVLLLFISAKGNVLALSDLTLVFAFIFSIHVFIQRRLKIDFKMMFVVMAYLILCLIYYYQFGWLNFTSSTRLLMKLLLGYFVVKIVQEELFLHFERIVVKLALISLPLYLIQLVAYTELKEIVGWFESIHPVLDYRDNWYVNSFIFTLNDNGMFRNSGFAWEPKGFANFLVFALMINLLKNQFRWNKSLIILLIALITTISTVGFFITVTCVFYIFHRNKKTTASRLLIPLYILAALFIFSLDFMYTKIEKEIEFREAHLKYIDVETDAKSITLGRFGSMQLAIQEFPKRPLFGIGMQDAERVQGKHTYIVWVNGLADWLTRFGLIGMVFLCLSYWLSCGWLFYYFQAKGHFAWFIACMSMFFASAIIINPFFIAFQFYGFTKGGMKEMNNVVLLTNSKSL